MNGFFGFLLHAIFIATFCFLFVITIIILKPFRIHRKRPVSTIIYKISYLFYLLAFLLLAYKVIFYSVKPGNFENISFDKGYLFYYIMVIIAFLLPNLAIMIRRKISGMRILYNYIFSIINVLIALFLVYLIYLLKI